MRTLSLLLALALVSFSGCTEPSQDATDDETPTGDPGSGGDGDTNGTGGDGSPHETTAPTADLTADRLNGTAPLQVNFTMDGAAGDANLTWTLAVNGTETANGTTLPANATHTFTEVGNVSVLLTVTAGNQTATASLVMSVEAAGGEAAVWEGIDEVLAVTAGCAQCSNSGAWTSAGVNGAGAGTDINWMPIPPEAIGRAFTVTSDTALANPDIQFATSCASSYGNVETFYSDGPESGVVPEGSACLFVWESAAPGAHIHVVIEGDG